jgi:hypothetical protein
LSSVQRIPLRNLSLRCSTSFLGDCADGVAPVLCRYGLNCCTVQPMQEPESKNTRLESSDAHARARLLYISRDALNALERRLLEHRLPAAEEAFLAARLTTYHKLVQLGRCEDCCCAGTAQAFCSALHGMHPGLRGTSARVARLEEGHDNAR